MLSRAPLPRPVLGAILRVGAAASMISSVAVTDGFGQSLPQYRVVAKVQATGGGVPAGRDMVRVELTYLDPATDTPVATPLQPIAFLRTVRPGQGDCATAVRAYSLNKGMFRDASSLTGRLILSSNSDGTLSFVDPLASLATANIFDIVQLPEPAAQVVAFGGDVGVLLPSAGTVALVDASGQLRTMASGMPGLSKLVVAEPLLMAIAGDVVSAFDAKGNSIFRYKAGARIVEVVPLADDQSADRTADRLAILDAEGRLTLIDALDGTEQPYPGSPTGVQLIAGNRTALLALGQDGAVSIHFPASETTVAIELDFVPDGLVVDGIGRHGFAWAKDGRAAAIIDLVRGSVIDRFDLPSPPSEALFSGRSLFLNHRNDANITLIDTGPLNDGAGKAAIRTYQVKAQEEGPTPMSVHDPAGGWILATPRGMSSADVIGNGNPTAPMTTTPLRGSRPLQVLSLDRSFRRAEDGRYMALGRLPAFGPVQLVTIADDYRTIRCFNIESTAPLPAPEAALVLTTGAMPQPGIPFTASLHVENDASGTISRLDTLVVTIRDMFGNREDIVARRQLDGAFTFTMTIGASGQYPVSAESHGISRPAVLTVGGG